ncbi:MAG: hypothetical protein M3328_03725, partial [Chloroflexota bacterium]|nr:hypothetical protein [Chloroflexota bacterium]
MAQQENRLSPRRIWILLVLLLAVAATSALLTLQSNGKRNASGPGGQAGSAPGVSNAILPGEQSNPRLTGAPSKEIENLRKKQAYERIRYGLPGQPYDPRWLVQGHEEAAQVRSAVPAGKVVYSRAKSQSPLALDPNSLISLGPRPGQSDTCVGCFRSGKVSGRINSILIDPTNTSTVY